MAQTQPNPAIVDDPETVADQQTDSPEIPEEHELLLRMLELFRIAGRRTPEGDFLVPGGEATVLQLRARILLANSYPEFNPGHSDQLNTRT